MQRWLDKNDVGPGFAASPAPRLRRWLRRECPATLERLAQSTIVAATLASPRCGIALRRTCIVGWPSTTARTPRREVSSMLEVRRGLLPDLIRCQALWRPVSALARVVPPLNVRDALGFPPQAPAQPRRGRDPPPRLNSDRHDSRCGRQGLGRSAPPWHSWGSQGRAQAHCCSGGPVRSTSHHINLCLVSVPCCPPSSFYCMPTVCAYMLLF